LLIQTAITFEILRKNSRGRFPENPYIVEFPNREQLNRKFREENQMEQNFPVRNFQKFGYTSRGCPIFREILKMLFHSPLEISRNSNRNFSSNGKHPWLFLKARKQERNVKVGVNVAESSSSSFM
jgi:hypothetical protein